MTGYTFVEIDMRKDFSDDPRAILPVPGTLAIVGKMRVIEEYSDLVLEVYDNHLQDDPVSQEEFKSFPPHCIPGTWGHERIAGLFTPEEPERLKRFPKNTYDVWKCEVGTDVCNAQTDNLLKKLKGSSKIVVGGVVTGICVKAFIEGIIENDLADRTILISDCVANLEGVGGIPSTEELFTAWRNNNVAILTFEEFIKEPVVMERLRSL